MRGFKDGNAWFQGRKCVVSRTEMRGFKDGNAWFQGRK
jgi:hypothetical protein